MNNNFLHLGIIPDGSRRWAKINNINIETSYDITMKKLEEFIAIAISKKIKYVSIYLSSVDNIVKRTKKESDIFQESEKKFISNLMECDFLDKIRIIPVGRMELLKPSFQDKLLEARKITTNNQVCYIYLLVAYDPYDELIKLSNTKLHKEQILENLGVPKMLDGIIRTSGELRLSNFLPYQSGYAELLFTEKFIPDISSEEFLQMIDTLKRRKRRKGQ